jgi:ribose/xylose/arabinose/galactoside ABC-type transport system permease subunit
MKKFLARHSPLVLLAGLCVVVAAISPEFRTANNLQNVAYRTAVAGIVATGQLLVILTGGIDLSVGRVAALSGMVACLLLRDFHVPVMLGIICGTMMGLFCGLMNGMLVTRGRIPPFIVTLGMMMVAQGATLLISGSLPASPMMEGFQYLGGAKGWWIPVSITVGLTLIFSVLLFLTRFGRALYAIGGNLASARLSGVPVDRMRVGAYALCGAMAGFAGVMLASRTGTAQPTAGEGLELEAIAACVIGGASLMGGEGGALGALAGALIMYVLVNICNLKGLPPYWQMVLVGALIIILVYYDNFRKRKAGVLKVE